MWFAWICFLTISMGSYLKPEARVSPLEGVCIWLFGKAVWDSLVNIVYWDRWIRIPSLRRAALHSEKCSFGYLARPCVNRWELLFGEIDGFESRAWGTRVLSLPSIHLGIWQGRVWFARNSCLARSMGSYPENNCFLNTFCAIDF